MPDDRSKSPNSKKRKRSSDHYDDTPTNKLEKDEEYESKRPLKKSKPNDSIMSLIPESHSKNHLKSTPVDSDHHGEKEGEENGNLSKEDETGYDSEERALERKRKKREKRDKRNKVVGEAKPEKQTAQELNEVYLKLWNSNRDLWKYKHARESWLVKNVLDHSLVSDEIFDIALRYLEKMKGMRRESLRTSAKALSKSFQKEYPDEYKSLRSISEARNSSISNAVQYCRSYALRKVLRSDD